MSGTPEAQNPAVCEVRQRLLEDIIETILEVGDVSNWLEDHYGKNGEPDSWYVYHPVWRDEDKIVMSKFDDDLVVIRGIDLRVVGEDFESAVQRLREDLIALLPSYVDTAVLNQSSKEDADG